ncbi:hypothetical protein MMC27_001226 [Xylographa pallens]|nr:hypothetical protein [Xylographa pallens]
MNDVMKNLFDSDFEVEDDWKKDQYQQQLRDRLSNLNTKNGHVPTAPLQFLPSPASCATISSYEPRGNSQQDIRETLRLHSAKTHNYALDPYIHNPLTPPDDHDHDAYKLDTMLLGPMQSPEQMPPQFSADTAKRQRAKSSTKGAAKLSKCQYQQPAPFQGIAPSLSDDPSSPKNIKRVAFLERNRMAAFKCRAKKKEWTMELEELTRDLKTSKEQHTIAIASLESELFYLKHEVFRHSDCSAAMCQAGQNHITANPDSELGALSNKTVDIVGRAGNEASPLPMTTEDIATQGIALQAVDDYGDFVDDADDYDCSSMHAISNGEFEALLTMRIAQDESGRIR